MLSVLKPTENYRKISLKYGSEFKEKPTKNFNPVTEIVIIDDEPAVLELISTLVRRKGYTAIPFIDPKKALEELEKRHKDAGKKNPDLILCDINLTRGGSLIGNRGKPEDLNGFTVCQKCKELFPQTPFILITGQASMELVLRGMKMGAFDFVLKPFRMEELSAAIYAALSGNHDVVEPKEEEILDKEELRERKRREKIRISISHIEKSFLKERKEPKSINGPLVPTSLTAPKAEIENKEFDFSSIIGKCSKMNDVFSMMRKVANTDSTVLIQGASGTGKELIAKALHYNNQKRKHAAFVAINCSALPENLLESELFGHKKGSFTGATNEKQGLFQEADNGTIFLDEINSMALPLQTKLLRVIQERRVRRVGENTDTPINVRIIASSNQALLKLVEEKKFREDLFYRLCVIPIEMPFLKERKEDIPLLVEHFLEKKRGTEEKKNISKGALKILSNYPWPGNVRELENAIERAAILSEGEEIEVEDLPTHIKVEVEKKTGKRKNAVA